MLLSILTLLHEIAYDQFRLNPSCSTGIIKHSILIMLIPKQINKSFDVFLHLRTQISFLHT